MIKTAIFADTVRTKSIGSLQRARKDAGAGYAKGGPQPGELRADGRVLMLQVYPTPELQVLQVEKDAQMMD